MRRADGSERSLATPTSFTLEPGERIVLGTAGTGVEVRAYLAVRGGWTTPLVLGSRSDETPLKAGDVLPCASGRIAERHLRHAPVAFSGDRPLRIVTGPDGGLIDPGFFLDGSPYTVRPRSDRAGLRLLGKGWTVEAAADRISAPVAPGAVQVAGGQPLLLGVACGTMGGYPHVAHVISADLDRVAQAGPGATLRFEEVSLDLARRLDLESRRRREALQRRVATAAPTCSVATAGRPTPD